MQRIVELCTLEKFNKDGKIDLSQYKLSKTNGIVKKKYVLTADTKSNLEQFNKYNSIVINKGLDYNRNRVFRLVNGIPDNVNDVNFSRNYILTIPMGIFSSNLLHLNISRCLINILGDIHHNLPMLKTFICSYNPLTFIPELPDTIEVFRARDCKLTALPKLPSGLKSLSVQNNFLEVLPNELIECDALESLKYDNNKGIKVGEKLLMHLDDHFDKLAMKKHNEKIRLIEEAKLNSIDNIPVIGYASVQPVSVYSDGQNAHNVTVSDSTVESLNNLMKDICLVPLSSVLKSLKNVMNNLIKIKHLSDCLEELNIDFTSIDDILRIKKTLSKMSDDNKTVTKALGYAKSISVSFWNRFSNDLLVDIEWVKSVSVLDINKIYPFIEDMCKSKVIYKKLDVSFAEVFKRFWNRLKKSESKDEIFKVFITTMSDLTSVCVSARFSGLVNCLCGFYDDIRIEISVRDQIESKYKYVTKKFKSFVENPLKFNLKCLENFKDLLIEMKLEEKVINEWISPFVDEIVDHIRENGIEINFINPYVVVEKSEKSEEFDEKMVLPKEVISRLQDVIVVAEKVES